MARLVFAMNVSLDGYVDHDGFAPGPELFKHWTDCVREAGGSLYGRRLYEIMRYWDEEQPGWGANERAFAEAWRAQDKWVVSASLQEVGPNATLVEGDLATAVGRLKAEREGEIDVGGPVLAGSLSALGLIDEYRLYYHPVVLGKGTPFFAQVPPALRLVSTDAFEGGVTRLTFVPA
ncbi:dihydrofolate reductase family protein [Algicella marina]|uniref:Dihydrofolate reductase n=1 Tax=Algicella marina TaxID=2683284 RepID=A0A6P1T402_9RHOB|nr:dihydrofolate reductase family protein [Algicella marina]QHQ36485.1 dihydrofolate reductase [Algicella marina]